MRDNSNNEIDLKRDYAERSPYIPAGWSLNIMTLISRDKRARHRATIPFARLWTKWVSSSIW